MMMSLSLVIITKNAEKYLDKTLSSVKGMVNEIILVDDLSTDRTISIAKKYGAHIFLHHEKDLGKQRTFAIKKAKSEWVLVLDADEWLSENSKLEILNLKLKHSNYSGYWIPFQTHFLGRPLHYGGESYKKLVLFKKDSAIIKPALVHEKYELIKGKAGQLKNKAYHYSYQSLYSMYRKFTDYGIREAYQRKKNKEKTNLKKIILYPLHMFWARFIKDKGYKDGLFRIPLDIGFAYMEFLSYAAMLFVK